MTRMPPGREQLHRPQVDFLVAAVAFSTASLLFANAGGSSTIVSNRSPARSSWRSSSNTFAARASRLPMPLRAAFRRMCPTASSETSSATTDSHAVGQLQGEGAVVAEAVEQAAARVARGGRAVLALIEEEAGLLAVPQVDLVLDAALAHRARRRRHLAVQQRRPSSSSPRAAAPARRSARGCPAGFSSSTSMRDDVAAAAGRRPARAPARPGSRRTDRRRSDGSRSPSPCTSRQAVASMSSDSPEGDRRRRAATRHSSGPAGASPTVSIRSAICDRSLNSARPTMRPARVADDDGVAARGPHVRRRRSGRSRDAPLRTRSSPRAADDDRAVRVHGQACAIACLLHHAESSPGNRVEFRLVRIAIGSDHAGFALKETHQDAARTSWTSRTRTSAPPPPSRSTTRTIAEAVAARGGRRRVRPRHPHLRHRHRHGDRRQQDPRHPRRPRLGRRDSARLSRAHNDANVMTLGGRTTPVRQRARRIVRAFLTTAFAGGRHDAPPREDRQTRTQGHTSHGLTTVTAHRRSLRGGRSRRSPPPSATRSAARPTGLELIASENFVSHAVLEAAGLGVHEQVRRGLSRAALLRRLRVHRRRRARWRSTARRRCSAPSTPTCSRTRARRPTWPCTSRC